LSVNGVSKIVFLLLLSLMIPGGILLAAGNSPQFEFVPAQTVPEGETLTFNLRAADLDSEPLVFNMITRPFGASLENNGDGSATFTWTTAFSGPNSSDGSPFDITFRVSDGTLSDMMTVRVTVLDKNRRPVIEPLASVEFDAGDLVTFGLNGSDPDNDPVSWEIVEAPEELQLSQSERSAQFSWETAYADSGSHSAKIALVDIHGASDTVEVMLIIAAQTIYELTIGAAEGYPSETVDISVNLMNLEPISSLNLLLNYDATALLLSGISESGTRLESFEYFTYSLNYNTQKGDIKVIAVADETDPRVALEPGDGSILNLRFYITGDYTFAGYSVPLRFVFKDIFFENDNTFTDPDGVKIGREAIVYNDGYILIQKADFSSVGDINLNGINYEISDAIYYINYFIDPGSFPLNPEQRANGDVNQDGISPTIADLVYLINRLVSLNFAASSDKLRYFGEPAAVSYERTTDAFSLRYSSEIEIGGLALTLETSRELDELSLDLSEMESRGMTVKYNIDGNLVRLVIYSDEGHVMPSGVNEIIKIQNVSNLDIQDIQLATSYGAPIPVVLKDEGNLPEGFRLHQNYPNPFNPITEIRFEIPYETKVELAVFNILGQEIRTLTSKRLPAGNHSVTWDGIDNEGTPVSSGIYFYRLKAGEYQDRKKMVLLK